MSINRNWHNHVSLSIFGTKRYQIPLKLTMHINKEKLDKHSSRFISFCEMFAKWDIKQQIIKIGPNINHVSRRVYPVLQHN